MQQSAKKSDKTSVFANYAVSLPRQREIAEMTKQALFLCRQDVPMKNNSYITQQTTFRFRRWSRHHYAVFCSIGRHINIGRLSNSIADVSTGKIGNKPSYTILHKPGERDTAEDQPADTSPVLELADGLAPLSGITSVTWQEYPCHEKGFGSIILSGKNHRQAASYLSPTLTTGSGIGASITNRLPRCNDMASGLSPQSRHNHTFHFTASAGENGHPYTFDILKNNLLYDNEQFRCQTFVASLHIGITPATDLHGETCRRRIHRTRRWATSHRRHVVVVGGRARI